MSRIPVGYRLRDFPGDRVPLCQRERNRTDSHKQEQIRRASNKMRFDGGIDLFFHVESLVKRSLSLFWLWTPYLLQKTIKKCQYNLQVSGFSGDPPHAEAARHNSIGDRHSALLLSGVSRHSGSS